MSDASQDSRIYVSRLENLHLKVVEIYCACIWLRKQTKVRELNERKSLVVEDARGLRHHHLPQRVNAVNTVHWLFRHRFESINIYRTPQKGTCTPGLVHAWETKFERLERILRQIQKLKLYNVVLLSLLLFLLLLWHNYCSIKAFLAFDRRPRFLFCPIGMFFASCGTLHKCSQILSPMTCLHVLCFKNDGQE